MQTPGKVLGWLHTSCGQVVTCGEEIWNKEVMGNQFCSAYYQLHKSDKIKNNLYIIKVICKEYVTFKIIIWYLISPYWTALLSF